jgi:hypothetical protein
MKAAADQLATLRAFALELFDTIDWPESCTLDGFDFQDLCEKHGLLIPREAEGPCNVGREDTVGCSCAEYGDFPQTCYRKAEWLTGRSDVAQK